MSEPALAWNPPADVRAAIAAVRVREQQGTLLSDGRGVQISPSPAMQEFSRQLRARFPAITTVGLRAGSNHHTLSTTTGRRDVHEEGRAADAMVPSLAAGEPIANYVSRAAQILGVQGLIWRRSAWWSDGRGFRAYGGTSPHVDHVHIEVGPDAAAWSAAEMARAFQRADALGGQSTSGNGWVYAAIAIAVLGGAAWVIYDD